MLAALLPALALVCGACAAPADAFMDVTYDPCDTQVVAHDGATADERDSLRSALSLWNGPGGLGLTAGQDPPHAGGDPRVLRVRYQEEFGAFRGVYDDEAGEIIVNRKLSGETRTIVLAHELGHAFGLWHVEASARRSVMNPGNTTVAPLPDDLDDVRALWGECR